MKHSLIKKSLFLLPALLLAGCNFKFVYNISGLSISGGGLIDDDEGIEDEGTYDIKIWVDDKIVELTKSQIGQFVAAAGGKVPDLKFISGSESGNFKLVKVAADKMSVDGIKLGKTNTYLTDLGIKKSALYDNKGIKDVEGTPAVADYYDAFTNVITLFLHYIDAENYNLNPDLYDTADGNIKKDASIEQYAADVKAYYDANFEPKDGGYAYKDASGNLVEPFKTYGKKDDEGKALMNWLDASNKYFGLDGFGEVAEDVFFTYNTFKVPTNTVLFIGVPDYTMNAKGEVTGIPGKEIADNIDRYSSQYGFVINSILNNMRAAKTIIVVEGYKQKIESKSLVFQLIAAEYLKDLAAGTESINVLWEKLGDVLENEVKPALDAVVDEVEALIEQSEADAEVYNEALAAYNEATDAAWEELQDALQAAIDAYREVMDPILEREFELQQEYYFNRDMYQDLMAVYAFQTGQSNPQAIIDYLQRKYNTAMDNCARLAKQIAKIGIVLDGIEDETLDEILDAYAAIEEILSEFDADELADLEFWYNYWKAAYEAAIEYISNQE